MTIRVPWAILVCYYDPVNESSAFRLEKDLVAVLRESTPGVLKNAPRLCRMLTETQVGPRIPDLLLFYSKPDRQRSAVQLTYFDCAILAAILDGQPIDVVKLAERTYASIGDIERRVVRLVRLGFVTARPDGTFALRRGVIPTDVRVVAVEAKLYRWREALSQAEAYFSFANESYIAMPSHAVRRNINALDACAVAGVGIIAVDDSGASLLLNGERREPCSAEWVRLVSNAVGINQTAAVTRANASRQAR